MAVRCCCCRLKSPRYTRKYLRASRKKLFMATGQTYFAPHTPEYRRRAFACARRVRYGGLVAVV